MSFLASLNVRAQARGGTLVFPEATDPRTAQAIARLLAEDVCSIMAVGQADEVVASLTGAGVDPGAVRLVDPRDHDSVDPLTLAGLLVGDGVAQGAVAGAVHSTRDVVRAALRSIGPADGVTTVSSAFYMLVPSFRGIEDEVLTFTDAGVVPEPTSEQLADFAVAAARARSVVVGDQPRIAFLSYSTLGSASGDSVTKVARAVDLFRARLPGVPVDGELQGDAALIEAVAQHKAPDSPVAGRANVLVFPDLNSGNIAYKLVQRITGGRALGPILQGLRRPYNDLSRGAEPDEIFDVACITLLMGEG